MWKFVILCAVALATAEKATYENYKVFRVVPTSEDQVHLVHTLEELSDGFSFWNEPSHVNQSADVMVAPHKVPEFVNLMNNEGIKHEVYVGNVQSLIDEGAPTTYSNGFDFTKYHGLNDIYAHLHALARAYPKNVEVIVGGRTYEGRDIKGVKVSFRKNNPGIFIEGGIHAREWVSPATVMYILTQIIQSRDPAVRELADRHDWYIFPSFNPDGYVYTHTTDRLWRKTRKPYTSMCYGTDPNRNWGYQWMNGGASGNACSETFAGISAFSDIETKSMSNYIKSISNKFYAYISFHSYSQLLLFPYGHTTAHLDNYDEAYAIGQKTIQALARRYGTRYRTGNIAETIYVATGGSIDWVKGTLRKPIAYTYELRDTGRYGFMLPPNQIIPTGEETLDSLVAMFKEARARGHPK